MSVDAIGQLERGRRRAPQRETVDLLLTALRPNDEDRTALLAAAGRARARNAQSPPAASRHNLPAYLSDLIGRESVVTQIHALLAEARLVTLVGAGGIGKTRAALEVAAREVHGWPDGVWLVQVAPVGGAGLVAGTIALTLGAVQSSEEPALETLLRHLKQKRALLLVDNCEHLVNEVANIAAALLRECPEVKLLATSRELLRVAGERVYPVPSLDDSSAASLFEKRARAADPAFGLTDRDAPDRCGDLPSPRRNAVGDRAGGRARADIGVAAACQQARRALWSSYRRRSHGAAAPTDDASPHRLELRSSHAGGATVLPAAGRLCRRLQLRFRRDRVW